MNGGAPGYKRPVSVLVVVYTAELDVLLLERADHPGYWQSVTGSCEAGETLLQTAVREVAEETGLDAARFALADWGLENVFEIYPEWRHRYAPGVTLNTEHAFGLALPAAQPIVLEPREHLAFIWLPWREAAQKAFSWTNVAAIERLPEIAVKH